MASSRFARGSEQVQKMCCSASTTGQGESLHSEGRLDFLYDNFRRHGHATADMRAGMHPMMIGNGGFDLLCQPAGYVKLRHEDMLRVLVASRISSSGHGRRVLTFTSPQRMPSSSSNRIASRPCDTAVPEATIMISASVFSVSIKPFSHLMVCLRERSIAAQISCCQLACVA